MITVDGMEFSGPRPTVDLTYSDVFLVPRHSSVASRLVVDLTPGDGTGATIPLVASNMNSVTGPRLAATLARRGGLGVLPQDLPLPRLQDAIGWVKRQSPRWDTPHVLSAAVTVAEAARILPAIAGHAIVVTSVEYGGAGPVPMSSVVGVISALRLGSALSDARLGDLIHGELVSVAAHELATGRDAFDAVTAAGAETVCVVERGALVGTLSQRSALRSTLYRPAVDHKGELIVGAAVGINGDVRAKATALVAAGADVVVVDTAHGHQDGMVAALRELRGLDLGVPIVAGNVVTSDGVRDLVNAGADILKVGVGPGAMCTTRMMTAVGRPQFSAVLEAAQAARELGAAVWADGGVRYPRDVALALAAGASSVMIGSWFAGTIESPGEVVADQDGRVFKESWGMASSKAVQARFGDLGAFERAQKELFAEGISSSRIYLDPLRPGVEDLVDMIVSGVRSAFSYAGAASVAEFHDRARVGLQSAAGYEEGKALPVSW